MLLLFTDIILIIYLCSIFLSRVSQLHFEKERLDFPADNCRNAEQVLARFAERVSPVEDVAFVCRFCENYFSTQLLTAKNHKPVVMLRAPYKWAEERFVQFAGRDVLSLSVTALLAHFFPLAVLYDAPQLTEHLNRKVGPSSLGILTRGMFSWFPGHANSQRFYDAPSITVYRDFAEFLWCPDYVNYRDFTVLEYTNLQKLIRLNV